VSRVAELRARREGLLTRSAALRAEMADHGYQLEEAMTPVDRGVNLIRTVSSKPVMVAAGASLLFALGPRRTLGWVSRGLFYVSLARRAFGFLAERRARQHPAPPGSDLFV